MSEQKEQQQQQQRSEEETASNEGQPEASAGNAGGDDQATSLEDQLREARDRLEKAEKALSEADLRAQAEVQNVRKRAERDVEHAHKFALEKFAGDILSVADSLERALATLDENDEALKPAREGTELTLKVLLDVFARYNIEQVDPKDEPFNPELHEAMTMVPSAEVPPNTVVDVLEKGYTLNGRLLRPARVVVSKSE